MDSRIGFAKEHRGIAAVEEEQSESVSVTDTDKSGTRIGRLGRARGRGRAPLPSGLSSLFRANYHKHDRPARGWICGLVETRGFELNHYSGCKDHCLPCDYYFVRTGLHQIYLSSSCYSFM